MEGQELETLVLQFPISKQDLCGQRVQNQMKRSCSKGRKKKDAEKSAETNRHGLLGDF